jgi:hypothetical protein
MLEETCIVARFCCLFASEMRELTQEEMWLAYIIRPPVPSRVRGQETLCACAFCGIKCIF